MAKILTKNIFLFYLFNTPDTFIIFNLYTLLRYNEVFVLIYRCEQNLNRPIAAFWNLATRSILEVLRISEDFMGISYLCKYFVMCGYIVFV
jgi:hypothetical protein